MKRFLLILGILWASVSFAAPMKPYVYLFSGHWQLSEDPILIDEFGYQDIQNMRRKGSHLKGVRGHERLTDEPLHLSHTAVLSAYQFKKDSPPESHILAQVSNGSSSIVIENTTAVPNRGEFSGVTLHADTPGAGTGKFCSTVQGNVAYCNGKESLIWGGSERPCHGFLTYIDLPIDRWEDVYNDDSETTVALGTSNYIYVGSTRRFDKVKFYISTANTAAVTIQGHFYTGWNWSPTTNTVDGTAVGAATLAQTGSVEFDYPTASHATFIDNDDSLLYWVRFTVTGVDAATAIYRVTVGESSFVPVENLWNASYIDLIGVGVLNAGGAVTQFFSDEIASTSTELDYADFGLYGTANYLIFGSAVPLRGLVFNILEMHRQTNAAVLTMNYWTSGGWSAVTGFVDNTSLDGDPLRRSGVMHWLPTYERAGAYESAATGWSNESTKYCYLLTTSAQFSDDVKISYIKGIPAQDKDVGGYKFPITFKNRLFLVGNESSPNQIRYSAFEQPDVFNGEDSGFLYVGGDDEFTSGGILYNVFLSGSYEQLLITKASETYQASGDDPTTWETKQISHNVGCSAMHSLISAEISEIESGVRRNICMWQSSNGIVLSDGTTVKPASNDISDYWDANLDIGISRHRIADSVAWYDPELRSYKLLISSGAETLDAWGDGDVWGSETSNKWGTDWEETQLEHNVELECEPGDLWWTKLYRENHVRSTPLQFGFQVRDTSGRIFTYGIDDRGYMYRLEYGSTWDGVPIHQYVWTKELLVDTELPLFRHTVLDYLRLGYKSKDFQSGETLIVTHYADREETVSGVSDQFVPGPIDMSSGYHYTSDCNLGPALTHSFKFDALTSEYEGMELTGLGLYYTAFDTIQE